MIEKPGLFKSTAWYGIGNLFSRFTGFLLLPFYSNILTTAEFGNYALVMSIYAILAVLFQVGLQSSFAKFYFDVNDEGKRKELFSTIFNSVLIVSALISTIIILFSSKVSSIFLGRNDLSSLIVLMIIALFIDTITYHILLLLKTEEKSQKVVLLTAIYAFANLFLNLFFVLYLRLGVEGILLAQCVAGIFLLLMLLPEFVSFYKFSLSTALLKRLLIFSFPLFLAGIFTTFVDVVDRFFIDYFFDKEMVGIYSFSYRIAIVMNLFVISFRTAWVPYSLRIYKTGDYENDFGRGIEKLLVVSIILILCVSLFTDDMFNITISGISLFQQDFYKGIAIIPIVMIGYLFNGIASYYSFYPYVTGKTLHFLYSDLLSFIVNVVLNFTLIPHYGIIGAAIATLCSFAAGGGYLFFISYKKIKINYRKNNLILIITIGLLFLSIGLYIKLLIFDLILIIAYLLLLKYRLKISLSELFKKIKN